MVAPYVEAVGGLDELRGDTHAVARALHAAFDAQAELVALAKGKPTFQWIEAGPMGVCFGLDPSPPIVRAETWLAVAGGARTVLDGTGGSTALPVYDLLDQPPGARAAGPAVIEGPFFTMRLPAGWRFDTTAAGDSFNAGYLAGRSRGLPAQEAALLGHRLAARVIGYRGAIIPSIMTEEF